VQSFDLATSSVAALLDMTQLSTPTGPPCSQTTMSPKVKADAQATRGRAGKWSKEQLATFEKRMPNWNQVMLVKFKHVEGRHKQLADWKKQEAVDILNLPEFQNLPDGVGI
jgi:hypothetical protein